MHAPGNNHSLVLSRVAVMGVRVFVRGCIANFNNFALHMHTVRIREGLHHNAIALAAAVAEPIGMRAMTSALLPHPGVCVR